MTYEINVSKNGKHYFATTERSIRSEAECLAMVEDFRGRFPVCEGFKVSASRIETNGYRIA